jgi:GxxExxY protein
MTENELATRIIGASIDVHRALGPGLLENVYKECLFYKLNSAGLIVEKEKPIPVKFEGIFIDCGYRLDLLVENKVVIELKSVQDIEDIHLAQVLNYLRLGNFKLGLLINFNEVLLKNGVNRVVNGL